MNKLVSFRDLIDLEPKPKKVKYQYEIYTYYPTEVEYANGFARLETSMSLNQMKEPNIEIIEEDVVISRVELDDKSKLSLAELYMLQQLNKCIDYINKKEGK